MVEQLEEGEWNEKPVPAPTVAAAAEDTVKLAELLDRDRGGMESPAFGLTIAAVEGGSIFALRPKSPTIAIFLLGELPVLAAVA